MPISFYQRLLGRSWAKKAGFRAQVPTVVTTKSKALETVNRLWEVGLGS